MYTYNIKLGYFIYKDHTYKTGTKFIYNGICYLNEEEVYLNNEVVTFLHVDNGVHILKDNIEHICPFFNFENKIVKIIEDPIKQVVVNNEETEFYWTDGMVVKTLWYIVIMLFAVIFRGCIGIWILATIIWYNSVFKNRK